jgi:ATP-dependent helicase HrpA
LIPLPAFVDAFADRVFSGEIEPAGSIVVAIAEFAKKYRKATLPLDAFDRDHLPDHLKLNYKLVDAAGHQIAMSRNLAELQAEYGDETNADSLQNPFGGAPTDRWDFGDLPESLVMMTQAKRSKTVYPAITACDDSDKVRVELYDSPETAAVHHRAGLICLLRGQLKEQGRYLLKTLSRHALLCSRFTAIAPLAILQERLLTDTYNRCFLSDALPRTQVALDKLVSAQKSKLIPTGEALIAQVAEIVDQYHQVISTLKTLTAFADVKGDIETQLSELVTENFWLDIPQTALGHYPRYLQTIVIRIGKLREDPARDNRLQQEFAAIARRYRQAQTRYKETHSDQLEVIRWTLEEFRVSLFAQRLKTPYPISAKRIEKMIDALM